MNQPTPTSPRGIWKATVRGVADVIVGRDTVNGEPCWSSVTAADGNYVHGDHLVTDLRPLVVLDPESTQDRDRLAIAWGTHDSVRDVLRALAAPKVVEPTGLGAVWEWNGVKRVLGGDGKWRDHDGCVLGWGNSTRFPEANSTVLSHGYLCTCGASECPGGVIPKVAALVAAIDALPAMTVNEYPLVDAVVAVGRAANDLVRALGVDSE